VAITPRQTHYGNAVSELVGAGAPHRATLNLAFLLYNLLVVAFGSGVLGAFDDGPFAISLSGWALVATGAVGIAMTWFPMDRIGTPATTRGIVHIVLAGIASVATMTTIAGFAFGARQIAGWESFATYSFVSFGVVLVTGAIAAISAVRLWPAMGLLERLTIGGGLQWMAVLAWTILERG
jgi:hypothetical protein